VRSLTINEGNRITYTRDDEAGVVEEWLARRGFVASATGAA
jgi:hypothetical protein